MKDLIKSWKFWAVIIALLLIIVTVVLLCFTVPVFAYATGGFTIGALLGFIGGYFISKKYAKLS